MTWSYCIQGRILSFDLPACHTLWPGHQSLSRVRYDMLRGLAAGRVRNYCVIVAGKPVT